MPARVFFGRGVAGHAGAHAAFTAMFAGELDS
jgi:hypothetical protein